VWQASLRSSFHSAATCGRPVYAPRFTRQLRVAGPFTLLVSLGSYVWQARLRSSFHSAATCGRPIPVPTVFEATHAGQYFKPVLVIHSLKNLFFKLISSILILISLVN
jgi:hypothetical protein